ncbi:MAG: carbohydrate porin, partial [Cyanobacteria bacterium REEB65]|nr:carbohydrate porin [Cyanobacteria bacterium REEB65]
MTTLAAASIVILGRSAFCAAMPTDGDLRQQAPATSNSPAATVAQQPSIQGALGVFGDPCHIRAALVKHGITYSFVYTGEVLGNSSGGVKRGATYEGQLDGILDIDLATLAGWHGATLHGNFYQIHGRGLTANNTLDLFTVSTLEAYPSTKLYEAWFEQTLADDRVAVRLGQIGADVEFFTAEAATVFYNPTFGAPALLANDLPSGGPTYPLAAP